MTPRYPSLQTLPPAIDGEPGTPATGAFWLSLLLPLLLLGVLHGLSQQYGGDLDAAVFRLVEATRHESASHEPPPPGMGRTIKLPLFVPRKADATAAPAWFSVPFHLPESPSAPYLLSLSFRPTLVVYLDGQLLSRSTSPELLDRGELHFQVGSRTLELSIPPSLLKAGSHELQLRIGSAGYDGAALSTVRLGPSEAMNALRAYRDFMQVLRTSIAVAAAALGLFLVVAWAVLRQEWVYGLAGVHCLLLALLLSPGLMADPPFNATAWRMLLDVADVVAKGLLPLLVSRLFESHPTRAERWIVVYLIAGSGIDAFAALNQIAWTDFSHPWPWWALGSRAAVLAFATLLACGAARQRGNWQSVAAAVVVGLGAWIWLYVSAFALVIDSRIGVVDFNFVGYGAWVFLIGVMLQRRYVGSLRREQNAREELGRQVRERTVQLEANFKALHESERLRLAAAERERLLQDMHDGLGSRLVAAKLGAQRGTMSQEDVVQAFDDCLQEMRLSVDALSVTDGDLALLLANLRHRLGVRIRESGLELDWFVEDAPRIPALTGAGGRELIRIVQEALNNVMHHAQAKRIRITTRAEGDKAVMLSIADNGRGLPSPLSEGRGMGNIRSRAARLGASVEWLDLASHAAGVYEPQSGTELRIRIPLELAPIASPASAPRRR